jgi:O-antigen/teichoic acid export membrane protein
MQFLLDFIHRHIDNRPNLLKIANNIGWLFIDKLLRMGVGLLIGIWVARYLGPAQFGLLSFALAFTGFFTTFATLGLQNIVVRDIVHEPKSAPITLGTAAMLQLVGGLVSFFMILLVIGHLRTDDPLSRTIVAILGATMLFKASEIAVYWFESQVLSRYTVWVQNGVFIAFSIIKIGLILLDASLTAFVWAMLAEAAVAAAILLLVFNLRSSAVIKLQASLSRARTLLKDSWPLILSGIAITVYMRIDQIMLGQMVGDEAVGIYSAAARISEVWYFIPGVIVASVFPAIIEAKKRSEELYQLRLQRLCTVLTWLAIAVALPITFMADFIVTLLYGEPYVEAASVLIIHIWSAVFVFLGLASGIFFTVENQVKKILYRTIFGAVSNVLLNIILIPSYGIIGAAVATLISQFAANYFYDLFDSTSRQLLGIKNKALFPIKSFW